MLTRNEHYYSPKQSSELRQGEISFRIKGRLFTLLSAGGIFSYRNLDTGTKLLLEKSLGSIPEKAIVLDLGCGYGAVGVVVATLHPGCSVVMSDVNERACSMARKNVKRAGLGNARVVNSNGFANIKEEFDCILLNPPQSAGKKVCERLISDSAGHLKKKGRLCLVARHQKGGRMLSEAMKDVFGNIDVAGLGSGFRVYVSEKV